MKSHPHSKYLISKISRDKKLKHIFGKLVSFEPQYFSVYGLKNSFPWIYLEICRINGEYNWYMLGKVGFEIVSFETVLNSTPEEVKDTLIFNLDLFL